MVAEVFEIVVPVEGHLNGRCNWRLAEVSFQYLAVCKISGDVTRRRDRGLSWSIEDCCLDYSFTARTCVATRHKAQVREIYCQIFEGLR